MKVAILLPGLVRTYRDTYESFFKNMVEANGWDADIFIHSWDITGNLTQQKIYGPDFEKDDWIDKSEMIDIADIREAYCPKKCFIENYDKWKDKEIDRVKNFAEKFDSDEYTRVLNSIMAQFYKLKKCFVCMDNYAKNNGVKYDLVIKARCDLLFEEQIIFDSNALEVSKEAIICPSYLLSLSENRGNNYINDQFAVGSMKNMRIYCGLYDRLFDVANDIGGDFMLYPEELLAHHLISNYVKIHILDFKSKLERGINNEDQSALATDS